jgi:RNA polymerase sigma-54 factor
MHLQASTSQRLEQRLLPQMLQSIEILQMTTADLLQLVAQQAETNEVLDLEPAAEAQALSAEIFEAERRAADEWEASGIRPQAEDVDGRRALLENQPASEDELLASVRMQAAMRGLSDELTDAIAALVGELDERGLLQAPLDEVAVAVGRSEESLQQALQELQTMEPTGLGAASGVEAMLLQAKGDPDYAEIEALLTQHLEALAANKWPEVARRLGIAVEELAALVERMRSLNPAPGESLRSRAASPLQPDVAAWLADGEVRVALAEDGLPQLALNGFYTALLQDKTVERDVRSRLRAQMRAAQDLIDAVSHRRSTLLSVTRAVFERQRGFLVQGTQGLVPLRMAEIADALSLHPSTISRAIAGKNVATPFGTMALRDFCSGGAKDEGGGQGIARCAVAERLQQLIDGEDRARPLSDEDLVRRMGEAGIRLARRTVAKMREELGVPSSYRRRQHGGGAS